MCSFRSPSSLSKPSRVSTSAYVLVLVWCNLFWEPLAQFVYSICCCSLLFTLVEAGWAKKARSVEPRGKTKREQPSRVESRGNNTRAHDATSSETRFFWMVFYSWEMLWNDGWLAVVGCLGFQRRIRPYRAQWGRDAGEKIMARDVDFTAKSMWILRRKRESFRWDDDSSNWLLIIRFLILYFIVHLLRFRITRCIAKLKKG